MKNAKSNTTICIVGRPNVGKSSLFNVLLGQRRAVVVEQSGTTRDRHEAVIKAGRNHVKLVDTGGYLLEDKDELSLQVKSQIASAITEASVVLFVTDAISGISPADEEVAAILRKSDKPIIMVVNKTDNDRLKNDALEFFQLGFGEPLPISCLHRRGVRTLKTIVAESVEAAGAAVGEEQPRCLKIAVVGRPNVGKSSFINSLLKDNRVIVSDIPGTTRDSIDTFFNWEDEDYILIDTAGIRHKRKIKKVVDVFSIMRSKQSIKRADVVVLLLDAADGITKDDLGILNFIAEEGKGCLILVNKWDLAGEVEGLTIEDYEEQIIDASNELSKFPLKFISAKTGKGVVGVISAVKAIDSNLDFKASTVRLNKVFEENDPSTISIPRRKKRPNFLYITQSGRRPVEFTYFVNSPSMVLPIHLSFIENKLRENFPFAGIPIKINLKASRKARKFSPKPGS